MNLIVIPDSVKEIEPGAFMSNKINSVVLPKYTTIYIRKSAADEDSTFDDNVKVNRK